MQITCHSLHCDQRGATAIEYAIIAGLIGLGLVGSLVTTRGSLSAVFGTASTQMGSAAGLNPGSSGSGPAAPAVPVPKFTANSPRAAFWNAKTLAGPVESGSTSDGAYKTYRFTDGTTVTYSDGYPYDRVVERSGDVSYAYLFDSNNGRVFQGDIYHYAPGTDVVRTHEFANPTTGSITETYLNTYPSNGSSQVRGTPSAEFTSVTANMYEDLTVFAKGMTAN